jgi:hypothetical protein
MRSPGLWNWRTDRVVVAAALLLCTVPADAQVSERDRLRRQEDRRPWQQDDRRSRQQDDRRPSFFGPILNHPGSGQRGFAVPPFSPFTLGCATPFAMGIDPWCAMQPYAFRYPPTIVLPPEERPHRFYERFHPGEGTGMPPFTCEPLSAAGCPPDPRYRGLETAPYAAVPSPSPLQPVAPACVEVSVRTVTGAVHAGRLLLPAYGATRIDELSAALQMALSRGEPVSIMGAHGYPVFLPPVAWIQTIAASPCRR